VTNRDMLRRLILILFKGFLNKSNFNKTDRPSYCTAFQTLIHKEKYKNSTTTALITINGRVRALVRLEILKQKVIEFFIRYVSRYRIN
jgi:hypothetical protein